MGLKGKIKKYLLARKLKHSKKWMHVGSESYFETTFDIRLTEPLENKKYLVVGEYSIIAGNIIFETNEGSLTVGNRSQISGGATIICRCENKIGDDVIIAGGTLLYDHDSHSIEYRYRKDDVTQVIENRKNGINPLKDKDWEHVKKAPIIINDKVWIGKNVTILKGVTIGEGAVVGAGAVVTHDVPEWTVVAGNPARVIKKIDH